MGAGILDRQAADVDSVAVDPESEWWRGVAVLLTWQGDWGLLHPTIELPLVDEGAGQRLQRLLPLPARGEETARAVDAEAEAQRAHPRARMVWEALQKFQTHVAERFVLDGVAVSLEICPETYMEPALFASMRAYLSSVPSGSALGMQRMSCFSSVPHKAQAQRAFC